MGGLLMRTKTCSRLHSANGEVCQCSVFGVQERCVLAQEGAEENAKMCPLLDRLQIQARQRALQVQRGDGMVGFVSLVAVKRRRKDNQQIQEEPRIGMGFSKLTVKTKSNERRH